MLFVLSVRTHLLLQKKQNKDCDIKMTSNLCPALNMCICIIISIVLCHKKTSVLMNKRWQLQPSMHQNVFLPLCACVLIDKGPGIDVLLDGCHFNSRIVSS